MMNPRFYAEWLALKAAVAYFRRGDTAASWKKIRRLAPVARWVLRDPWRWALRNLELVFGPQLDERARSRLALIAWEQHLGSYVEGLRHEDVVVRSVNEDRVRAAYDEGRGLIVCSVHLGSWEAGVRFLAKTGAPHALLYRRAANPLSEREFQALRASSGSEWIDTRDLAGVVRVLRKRQILVMMTDLNTLAGGVPADFLGITAMCPRGPAWLAIRQQCPIMPVVTVRDRDATVTCYCEPQLDPPACADDEASIRQLTRTINATFEPWVIEYADQYNWFHPRWRFRPDGRMWRVTDPIEGQWAERVAGFSSVSERVRRLLGPSPEAV
jgi:KDO2-lipid IV(A) lauroyltransferase